MLVWSTGLGDTAHAMSKDCVGGHCDSQMPIPREPHHIDHADVLGSSPDTSPASNNAGHDGCDPFYCHVPVLMSDSSSTHFTQFETVLAWHVVQMSALEPVDTPDRPPNL